LEGKERMMAGALNGVRVIDFGQYIAGPLTALMLGDQGAEVIRVDPPGGPFWKTPANATWNRGKKSIVLDLKQESDRGTARRLVGTADVVIENFRPGVMDRLGLGPEAMTGADPRLIYCSIPGFAADDPRAGVAAYEGVVAAATDTYRAGRDDGGDGEGRPHFTELTIASNFAAFLSATSITLALIARERDGRGQRIEVPLFDAMFEAFGGRAGLPDNRRLGGGQSLVGVYQCQDGRWVHFAPFMPRFVQWFIDAAGVGHWRDEGILGQTGELRRRFEDLFRTGTALEWEELGKAAGLPLSVCRTNEEWIGHEHARASRAVVQVDDPEYGPIWQPGFPVSLSLTPGETSPRHPLDADRTAVLSSLEASASDNEANGRTPLASALEGIRILDLTQVLAAPTAGRILADFGADVIKINNPRDANVLEHVHLNRSKRTMLLDLQSKEGLDILYRLIGTADVFMQNFTKGQSEKLGFGYEQVRAHKPSIIYSSVSAYNHDGPWGAGRGYEPMGQATSGMKVRAGGDGPPASQPFAVNDYGTGVLGAFSIALGLFHRLRTGEAQHVQASLAQTGTYHQTPYFYSYAGMESNEPRRVDGLGLGPLYRLYRASAAWFFLAARQSGLAQIGRVEGLGGIEGLSGEDLERTLEERFVSMGADEWVARLHGAGIGAHALRTVDEIMEDPWVVSHGLSLTFDHPGVGRARRAGPPPRLSRTPARPRPASAPGMDGPSVLAEIGLGDRAEELAERGIVPHRLGAAGRADIPAAG
jgi:crotonobetainyl-CoA:carnitine CoA-transferase CaiB-like acyl-CoA transferase